jgi:tetratricopeptide (TPR) repeat protein
MLTPLFSLLLALAISGCATHADSLRTARYQFFTGDLQQATETLDKAAKKHPRERDVLQLERAMVELAAGRPSDAERTLREVRNRFDELEQTNVAALAAAAVTDDTRLPYSGEDYEKVLLRAMLSISNLFNGGDDALAYALQVGEKQQQIIAAGADTQGNNPKLNYQHVALGPFVYGMLREETHSNYDDAERSYAKVVSWQPDFMPARWDLERARSGHHSPPGHGVLYVFTFVGRGPYKEETLEIPTTVALTVADAILKMNRKYALPPIVPPVKVPKVVRTSNYLDNVQVAVDGRPTGTTATITDVSQMAIQQHTEVYPQIVARAVVRRVVKKGIVETTRNVTPAKGNALLGLALDAGEIVWAATEAADTRCWGLLPDKIQVLRVELPAGTHRIALQPAYGPRAVGQTALTDVQIDDGRNTYVLANFPNERLVGQVLVSNSAAAQP